MSDIILEALERIASGSPKIYGFEAIRVAHEALVPYSDRARRIVACVNACAGIDTESLEKGIVSISYPGIYTTGTTI